MRGSLLSFACSCLSLTSSRSDGVGASTRTTKKKKKKAVNAIKLGGSQDLLYETRSNAFDHTFDGNVQVLLDSLNIGNVLKALAVKRLNGEGPESPNEADQRAFATAAGSPTVLIPGAPHAMTRAALTEELKVELIELMEGRLQTSARCVCWLRWAKSPPVQAWTPTT